MRRTLCLVALTALAAATEAPAWFSTRAPGEAGMLVGLGYGRDPAEARQTALADLVEQLVVTVSSDRTLNVVQEVGDGGGGLRQELRQVLRSSSGLRDLAGVENIRRTDAPGACWMAVGIARDRIAPQLLARIAALDGLLSGGAGERPSAPDAAWTARMRALLAAAVEREALAAAAAGQGAVVAPAQMTAAVLRNHLGGLARPVIIRIEGDAPPLAAALAAVAGDLGCAVAGDGAATHRIRGSIARTDSTTARGWAKVRLTGEMVVTDTASGHVIGRIAAESAATSTLGAEPAAAQAAGELARSAGDALRSQLLLILLRNRTES